MSIEGKITKAKLDQAISLLKTKSPEELAKKLDGKNREEILAKLDEIDGKKLAEMNIDPQKVMRRLTPADLEKVRTLAGKDADVLMKKIRELLGV